MATSLVFVKSIGEVTLFKNRRSKSIKITVKPDKSVLVSFPYYISEKEVVSFLKKNTGWIENQRQKTENKKSPFSEGSVVNTKFYKICFYKGENEDIQVEERRLNVTLRDFNSDRSRLAADRLITRVYGYEARQVLPGRLKELAAKYGFSYNKITVRNNKCNWGSCSSRNNISLNLQMMKLPDELIDYILLHELVHTQIKDHSARFWNKLDQVTGGNAKELAKKVKKYSTYSL